MSTDKQRQLGDYTTPSREEESTVGQEDNARSADVSAPGWIDVEGEDDEDVNYRHCQNCESHVTAEFARVSGDNDNVVHRCTNCANGSELAHGAAGIEDFEHRVEGGLYQ